LENLENLTICTTIHECIRTEKPGATTIGTFDQVDTSLIVVFSSCGALIPAVRLLWIQKSLVVTFKWSLSTAKKDLEWKNTTSILARIYLSVKGQGTHYSSIVANTLTKYRSCCRPVVSHRLLSLVSAWLYQYLFTNGA